MPRITQVVTVQACWSLEDVWQVTGWPGVTVERRPAGWYICTDGAPYIGPKITLAEAMRTLAEIVGESEIPAPLQ